VENTNYKGLWNIKTYIS